MSQPYFGVPLSDIVRREGRAVPNLVSKIASFLLERGIDQVGIFRVSGNSKVVERLRTTFDRNGDAALADAVDVMAVAGLLKLFFRELPETLIPERLTQRFVVAQDASVSDPDGYVREVRRLLATLPECNYSTLKYLVAFLVMVAREESANKMNANALATIFGPNMFRCVSSGLPGLKEQGVTNCVMFEFIRKYNELFLESGERSPYDEGFQLSDVVLSKPSSAVLHHEVRPVSRLLFQAADKPNRPTSSGDATMEGITGQPSSAAVASYDRYSDRNSEPSERAKSSLLPVTPMLTVIQEAIDQAILEYVFGETIESLPESGDEMRDDESDNSWSLSDDDNRAPQLQYPSRLPANNVQPSAKAIDSDSVSESDMSSSDSDSYNRRQRHSDATAKTASDGQTQDRDWAVETEMKYQRPASGSANPASRAGVPVTSAAQHRATSAPARPSNIGTKENFGQTNSTTAVQYSRNVNYTNRRNDQGAHKSPLVEKQAWAVEMSGERQLEGKSGSLRHQNSVGDQPTRGNQKESGVAEREEQYLAEFKRLTKQIHACKKKVKEFEEDFEAKHGYKPMHSDRMSNREVRRCLEELPEARRQLNDLREAMEAMEAEKQDEDRLSGPSRKTSSSPPTIEDTLATLIVKLEEKRQAASRPESLSEMTRKEICEEKLCIQKALLHFETIHGRPSSSSEKEIMHPLYDRYRRIKRLLEKMSDGSADGFEDIQGGSGNLSFVSACTQSTAVGGSAKGTSTRSNRNNPVNSPTKSQSIKNMFTVGRGDPTHRQSETSVQRRKTEGTGTRETMGRMLNDDENLNLNQLSIPRLMSELQRTKTEKKRLQLVLHNFEEEFQRENGRKIQKYDQLPLEAEYRQYKTIKAKLKLLEVLIAKHQQTK